MAFFLHSTDDGRELPFEYLPCAAVTPKNGMAMKISSGKLTVAAGTDKPAYICMREESAAVASGTVIPAVKVQPDQRWKVKNTSSFTVGTAYTVNSAGTGITTTSTGGVFTVDETRDGEVIGRFL